MCLGFVAKAQGPVACVGPPGRRDGPILSTGRAAFGRPAVRRCPKFTPAGLYEVCVSVLSAAIVVADLSMMCRLAMYADQRIAEKNVTPGLVTLAWMSILAHWCVPSIIGLIDR